MAKRYVVWDKISNVITPIGEVLTPEEWIARRPVAGAIPTVVAGGAINGAFFGVYDNMIDFYEKQGCDFSSCTTEQEYLDAIEAFEDLQNMATESTIVSAEERIAAALEAQVMMSMPDEETAVE